MTSTPAQTKKKKQPGISIERDLIRRKLKRLVARYRGLVEEPYIAGFVCDLHMWLDKQPDRMNARSGGGGRK